MMKEDMKREHYLLFLIITTVGCRKPYNPPAITTPNGYLVVEGVINSGSDSTFIKLSHTVNISSKVTTNPVLGAMLTVESDKNAIYSLIETTNGNYVSAGLNLDISGQYRLRIKTPDNKKYLSDFVPVKVTPLIDSIGYTIKSIPDTGIQIYANTHDQNNNTRYYRWSYEEAWEFHSKYISYFISNGSAILLRLPEQNITICYTNDVSSDIVLGSSSKLQRDMIFQNPIVYIPSTSEKIEDKYSILLHEYALTGDAYSFWVNLRKNTEQLGSIFDALPSEVQGNIHCITNPSERVIGYTSACTVSSKRIFIYNYRLPAWVPTYPYACSQDTNYYVDPHSFRNTVALNLIPFPDSIIPTTPLGSFQNPIGFLSSSRECTDCTIRGSKTPPVFWR
jgi:hypothetical protein